MGFVTIINLLYGFLVLWMSIRSKVLVEDLLVVLQSSYSYSVHVLSDHYFELLVALELHAYSY